MGKAEKLKPCSATPCGGGGGGGGVGVWACGRVGVQAAPALPQQRQQPHTRHAGTGIGGAGISHTTARPQPPAAPSSQP
jgi:hypothetical protein